MTKNRLPTTYLLIDGILHIDCKSCSHCKSCSYLAKIMFRDLCTRDLMLQGMQC